VCVCVLYLRVGFTLAATVERAVVFVLNMRVRVRCSRGNRDNIALTVGRLMVLELSC
jgi:hypothetical protein